MSSGAYRRAGVDLEAAARAVDAIRGVASLADRPEVVSGVGGFAGLFRIGGGRLLAAAADGVGTKTELARSAGRLDTIGVDLVAMCANDVVCTGAEPLFFLDYVAAGRVVPEEIGRIVAGVAEGCRLAGCALLGGETAEHPGLMEEGRFDLAGFCVGVVDEGALLGPYRVEPGDALVGVAASGLHANGFSLVRRLVAEGRLDLEATVPGAGRPLLEALLEPTPVYVPAVLGAAASGARSAAHVTGGGLVENVPRALPDGAGAELWPDAWEPPPVLKVVADAAEASREELRSVFNSGVGMVLVAPAASTGAVASAVAGAGFRSWEVGRVTSRPGVRFR